MTEEKKKSPGIPPRPSYGHTIRMSRQPTPRRENRSTDKPLHKKAPSNDASKAASGGATLKQQLGLGIPPSPKPYYVDTGARGGDGNNGNDNDDGGDNASIASIATLGSMTPKSMRSWKNTSFDEQSVHTLQTAWTEMQQDHIHDARPILPKIAFCMGDIRDGLAMVSEPVQWGTKYASILSYYVCMTR